MSTRAPFIWRCSAAPPRSVGAAIIPARSEGGSDIAIAPPAANERQSLPLTDEQRRIAEHADGPLVVIAGAGTGKTRVIVERVRWLLETTPDLLPEQILVLTYNVKAAKELQGRLEQAVGPAIRARMTVSNFHRFCHRMLTESASEASMPPNPDVLDGVGQLLLIRDLRPNLHLIYHSTDWSLAEFVKFINRAKDELVTPADFGPNMVGSYGGAQVGLGTRSRSRERWLLSRQSAADRARSASIPTEHSREPDPLPAAGDPCPGCQAARRCGSAAPRSSPGHLVRGTGAGPTETSREAAACSASRARVGLPTQP